MRTALLLMAFLCLPACLADEDGDGWDLDQDCDDGDPSTHPEAQERCDGVDNDCDSVVDEEAVDATLWFPDLDGDLHGDPSTASQACSPPALYLADNTDCDDGDAGTHPGASEVCDGADNDCDGDVDEEPQDAATWYADQDQDGWGDASATVTACDSPPGHVAHGTDCDDSRPTVHPGADEVCDDVDQDCDGTVDEDALDPSAWYADLDGDGWGAGPASWTCDRPGLGWSMYDTDCDDGDGSFHPEAPETNCADPNDYDCDGVVAWADEDGDGWAACLDCNDFHAEVWPGALETCNDIDDDCDGATDVGAVDAVLVYLDGDGDGWGDEDAPLETCDTPVGYVPDPGDCDDSLASTWPAAPESCDGVDNDCDGLVDDSPEDASTWYEDADGDGWGTSGGVHVGCAASGWVSGAGDCDDGHAHIHPDMEEVCDGVDQDCDGAVDEDALDAGTWFSDADGDGWGDPSSLTRLCSPTPDLVADGADCDDADPSVSPGVAELCGDEVDQDCDDLEDEGCVTVTHCGTLSSDEVWGPDAIHQVTCTLDVSATLVIEDGTRVLVNPGVSIGVGAGATGTLDVRGGVRGVTFTSASESPAPGDWMGVVIGARSSGSRIQGATIEYAGGNLYGGIRVQSGASLEILDSVVRHHENNGVCVEGEALIQDTRLESNVAGDGWPGNGILVFGGSLSSTGTADFAGNTLTDNEAWPVSTGAGAVGALCDSSTYTGNGRDQVHVLFTGTSQTVTESATWRKLDVEYYVDTPVNVYNTEGEVPMLTVEDGVHMVFGEDGSLTCGLDETSLGALVLYGEGEGVHLVGESEVPGSWPGIVASRGCTLFFLHNVEVGWAGDEASGAISLYHTEGLCMPYLAWVTVYNPLGYGVYCSGAPATFIEVGVSGADGDSWSPLCSDPL